MLYLVTLAFISATVLSAAEQSRTLPPGRPMAAIAKKDPTAGPAITFPFGTATPSEFCGDCHGAVYLEHAVGFAADLKWKPIIYKSLDDALLAIPPDFPDTGTAHHLAGADPWPLRARDVENGGQSCNVCHYPEAFEIPDIDSVISNPVPRTRAFERSGVTCASCHLTPDGKIRGSYSTTAPHETLLEPRLRTSVMCAYCHSAGQRVVGKQTQTFYEWRDDFYKTGLGQQHCQDCHMPRTIRSLAEGYNVPPRIAGRHVWTGDHSPSRIGQGLNLTVIAVKQDQPAAGPIPLEFHVVNVAAGHSVPTGSNRRGIYLTAQVLDSNGAVIATREWMFAPWYGNRPDDRAFLDEDKLRRDAIAATQADAQGPHEAPVRAGEDRVLSWSPELGTGTYTVQATLTYDLNRYNDRAFTGDQTEIARVVKPVKVIGGE